MLALWAVSTGRMRRRSPAASNAASSSRIESNRSVIERGDVTPTTHNVNAPRSPTYNVAALDLGEVPRENVYMETFSRGTSPAPLDPWYVTGFVEGEGAFTYSRSGKQLALYFGLKLSRDD